ncbi:MAG: hypothetical protein J5883_06300 [Clostridiales bacterium]|nr:hypothetical protein [Clostridiales bacterium]
MFDPLRITSIKEAIDNLSNALAFSEKDGNPVLVNRKMDELYTMLTGHGFENALEVWDTINSNAWVKTHERMAVVRFSDGTIWRFVLTDLQSEHGDYIQIDGTDFTEIYTYTYKIRLNNIKLQEQYKRQRNILTNIVDLNREKEIVSLKMNIHDELGRCLIATDQYLSSGEKEDFTDLKKQWNSAISYLEGMSKEEISSSKQEILDIAALIGCTIEGSGDEPETERSSKLMTAAAREALTNAVRHAHADMISIVSQKKDGYYDVTITDNGTVSFDINCEIMEGEGLKNLRNRLEQEGGSLDILTDETGMTLKIRIPV